MWHICGHVQSVSANYRDGNSSKFRAFKGGSYVVALWTSPLIIQLLLVTQETWYPNIILTCKCWLIGLSGNSYIYSCFLLCWRNF